MTTSRIKEKISALVSSQLPEFIQSDFPTFISFIEAYYKFLEQDQGASELIQNARSYNDIDTTTNDFVEFFLNTYAKNIPKNTLVNDRFLVKKIKDLYEAKGSELSFKLLFRILFDTDVSIKIPFENVLRASGGNWQQNFSIRVETLSGNRNQLTNRSIKHTANGVIFTTPITRLKNLTNTLTEIFLDNEFLSSNYNIGDLVEVFEGNTLIFSGTISPTTTSFRIDQPGTGFKVGQIFNISAGGIDTLIKVTSVSSVGGLENFKIISYGYGYSGSNGTNILTVALDNQNNIVQRNNFLNSKVSGFGSSGVVLKSNTSSPDRYFDSDYTSDLFYTIPDIVASFNNDLFNPIEDFEGTGSFPVNLAVIVFTLGALGSYPGAYFNDQSFLSEFEVRLQDDQLYQPFAYQTNTDKDLSIFVDIVKKLLNPAGQNLFNNRILQTDIDLSSRLGLAIDRKIFINLHDSVKDVDSLPALEINTFNENLSILDSDELYTLSKFPIDSVNVNEISSLEFQTEIIDSVSMSDETLVGFNFLRVFDDSTTLLDSQLLDTNKGLLDSTLISEQIQEIDVFTQDYFAEEYISVSELNYVLTNTNTILNP